MELKFAWHLFISQPSTWNIQTQQQVTFQQWADGVPQSEVLWHHGATGGLREAKPNPRRSPALHSFLRWRPAHKPIQITRIVLPPPYLFRQGLMFYWPLCGLVSGGRVRLLLQTHCWLQAGSGSCLTVGMHWSFAVDGIKTQFVLIRGVGGLKGLPNLPEPLRVDITVVLLVVVVFRDWFRWEVGVSVY